MVRYDVVHVGEVTLDDPSTFKHIAYGLGTGLAGSGANTLANLGIGFVDGSAMTETMPIRGTATYVGNWVANVQEADPDGDGDITRRFGDLNMTADFKDDEVTVGLTGLATLEGTIEGNIFEGTDVSNVQAIGGLDNTDSKNFTGSFRGGFYGEAAAEAGGVFDYGSKGNKMGAFRGAFGGRDTGN